MTDLKTLLARKAELDAIINAEIEKQHQEKKDSAKILKKIKATKLTPRTSHKYFDLQATYMLAIRGE